MMYLFDNNGLRFYPTDISGNPNPVKESDLPHCNFSLPKHFVAKFWQAANFEDISVIQLVSSATPVVGVLNLNTLVSEAVAGINIVSIDTLGVNTVYEITINWASYTNVSNEGKGMQITINNGIEYAKSEPIKQPNTFLKLYYQNTRLHAALGSYTCDRKMIMYVEGYKEAYTAINNKEAFATSVGTVINLKQDTKEAFTFRTGPKPLYIHNILSTVFISDVISIEEILDTYVVTEEVQPLLEAVYDFETVQGNTAGEGQIQLFKKDSYVKKFVSENTLCDRNIEVKLCGLEGQTANISNLGINPIEVGETLITEYTETEFVRFEKVEINGIAVAPDIITDNIDGITDYIKVEITSAEEDPINTEICFYFRDVTARAIWDFTDDANKIVVFDGVNDKATAVLDKSGNNHHLFTSNTANAPFNNANAEDNVLFERPLGGADNLDSTLTTQSPAAQGSPIGDPTGAAVAFDANIVGLNIAPFRSPMFVISILKHKFPNNDSYRSDYIGRLLFEIRIGTDTILGQQRPFGEIPKNFPTKELVSNAMNNPATQGTEDDFSSIPDYTLKRAISLYGEKLTGPTNGELIAFSNSTEVLRRVSTGSTVDAPERLDDTKDAIRFALVDQGSGQDWKAINYYAYEMRCYTERLTVAEQLTVYTELATKHSI